VHVPAPSISVVVATHNRARLLPRLVDALAGQEGAGAFEVVVVDDGSTDDTWAVLQDLAARHPFLVPVRQVPNAGPAAARNRGWRAACAELVAFTDDDCVPQPGWLHALRAALADVDIAQGRTVPDPRDAERLGPFGRTLEVTAELGYYQTCNMAYRRDALERVGGFDERFRRPSGEDTDLAWRLKERGASSLFVPNAVVHHDVRPSSLSVHLRDTWRWGDCVLTVREHPQLRELLHRRWFFRQSHPPAIAGAVGLGLLLWPQGDPLRRAAGVALIAPYVDLRMRRWPLRGGPRRRVAAIPAALVADIVEVGVMLAASVRYRTLVL
jgi:glycosyltransferase involved in cell wall biosynthesis